MDLQSGEETTDFYSVAGRIMAMRNNGMFIDLMDSTGKIQLFIHKENLPEDKISMLKLLDMGDIFGASGTIRRTPRGELSLKVKDYKILPNPCYLCLKSGMDLPILKLNTDSVILI